MLVTSKPVERRSVLEEAAGISGIHARRHEAENRLNAAENNLKRADELKKQQEKQLQSLKKQAEEATKYKEISKEIKKAEAGLYYLKLRDIEKNKKNITDNVSEQDDEISAIKIDLNHNNSLLKEENEKLSPLRDRKIESLAKLQKLNLDLENLEEEEQRVKKITVKLQNSLSTLNSDLDREKSITLDANVNEKRILKEKKELIETENSLGKTEALALENVNKSKENLSDLKNQLNETISKLETMIDNKKLISKDMLSELKKIIDKITLSQEQYAIFFSKNETVKNDSIKRKERIKNIDIELENWKNLKSNSEKMIFELQDRKEKIIKEIEENQKNPERLATKKGQNIQNLDNTKKRSEELEDDLKIAEERFNKINKNIQDIQEKLTTLREDKARNEATLEGIETRKKDLFYSISAELGIENETKLFTLSELNLEKLPSIDEQQKAIEKIKKDRESLGSVNLRADVETKKYEEEIKKMEDDRADLYSAIIKLKTSIEELNQKGRERLLDAFEKVNRKFNEVYTKLFSGGSAKLELVDSDDPLEAGLEMFVSPPGKRLQSITLLSGGEQALTALSLVFAVFLVNPSPICVLDEVDAPLDDANVTRFCALLDELTNITQTRFIIITHHALTMSRMHRLYGITMPEKGVSQLVAVDLQKAEELVA